MAIAVCEMRPAIGWAQQPVDLQLVLAIDTSTSVDNAEFALQRQGLAAAFRYPDVIHAIVGLGESGMAVTLVQWAGVGAQMTSIDWMFVNGQATAAALSRRIGTSTRQTRGFTDIAGAIRFSAGLFRSSPFSGRRLVIDVSGDGTSSAENPAAARDRAVASGITINGLVIYNQEYDLGELASIDLRQHFANHVIGGPGAFLMVADDFDDFARAIRKKLVREITGPLFSETTGNQRWVLLNPSGARRAGVFRQ